MVLGHPVPYRQQSSVLPATRVCGPLYSTKSNFYSFHWILSNVLGNTWILLLGQVSGPSILGEAGDNGGSRQCSGARSVPGPQEQKMLKGERNTSINVFKAMVWRLRTGNTGSPRAISRWGWLWGFTRLPRAVHMSLGMKIRGWKNKLSF